MQAISTICQIFSEQLGWSLRQETKDWSNIPDDQEILCKKKFFRLVYTVSKGNIHNILIKNIDQTEVVFVP